MEIKDYLHLYLGCEVLIQTYGEDVVCKIRTVSAGGGMFASGISKDGKTFNSHGLPTDTKLILLPLSELLVADAERIGEMIDPYKEHEDDYNGYYYSHIDVGKSFANCFKSNDWEDAFFCKPKDFIRVVNKCRQLGYDMDGLIDAGLAIDKTKLNSEQKAQECDANGLNQGTEPMAQK